MPFIYRTAVTITRKQPYIDWANSLGDGVTLTDELAGRKTVYLVGHADDDRRADDVLGEWWAEIFDEELFGWMEDEAGWPAGRSRAMFDDWFDAEVADSVVDLDPEEPLTEEDMDAADLEYALHTCGWCEGEMEEGVGRLTGFVLEERELFEDREGLVLTLPVERHGIVTGVVTPSDSTPAAEGYDLMFRACSRRCEKLLQKSVPRSLRRLTDHLKKIRASR